MHYLVGNYSEAHYALSRRSDLFCHGQFTDIGNHNANYVCRSETPLVKTGKVEHAPDSFVTRWNLAHSLSAIVMTGVHAFCAVHDTVL